MLCLGEHLRYRIGEVLEETRHQDDDTTYFTPTFSISHLPVSLRHTQLRPLLVFALVPLPLPALGALCRGRPRTFGDLPRPVQHHHRRLGQAGQVGQAVGRGGQRREELLGGGGGGVATAGRTRTACMKITHLFGEGQIKDARDDE